MKDQSKKKQVLIQELVSLRERIVELEQSESERKQTEEEIQRIKAAVDATGDAIGMSTADGHHFYQNEAFNRLFGYTQEEVYRLHPTKLYGNKDIAKGVFETIMAGKSWHGEIEMVTKNGRRFPVLLRADAVKDENGKVISLIGVHTDITERKLVEKSLHDSEERFKNLYQDSPIPTFTWQKKGDDFILVDFNKAAIQMTNGRVADILGNSAVELYRNSPQVFNDMNLCYKERSTIGREITSQHFAPGRFLTVNYGFIPPDLIIVHTEDQTNRKRAEEELKQSEARYRSIFDNAQEGIFQTTYEGQYLAANRALATILGYDSPEELMTTVMDITTQLYVNPENRKVLLKMIEEQDSVKGFETQFYRKDGSIIWVSVNQHAVRDAGGRVLHYEGFNEDITMKKGSIERMKKALWATVQAIAVTVETRDPYTAGHQRRVADLARAIAMEMNIPTDQIDGILMAAIIHDIGKISVPAEILSKPSKLTDLEFGLIKTHAQSGYDILKDIEFPWPIARMVLEHHERMDGSGYPGNLNGDDILMEARILAVSDVVEAMGSHRPYRPSRGIDAALEEIENKRGTHYDTSTVDACLRLFREKGYQLEGTSF